MAKTVVNVDSRDPAHRLNRAYIKLITRRILRCVRTPSNMEIDIVFLGDRGMRALNKKYKGMDRSTDVLSFGILADEIKPKVFFGEIIISTETAYRNSREYGTSFQQELMLYVIHGMLHLFGYDDGNAKESLTMSKAQERILKKICKKESLSKVLTPR